jgi:hypothetical protein
MGDPGSTDGRDMELIMSSLALVHAAKHSYPMDIGGAYPGGKAAEALTSIQWRVEVYVEL